ncbi:hypothetical protein [Thermomonospora umbrina]|uniref:Uncharacterized protein n=1 Tax=Thermomonospora umbrina TaxID=111806 RepID=A0A3D9T2E2_9ACTN|nr:hypothetical protein [Thermomonospora umbrina]REE98934.1 hypothetical protein DFJ69_4432 [Thermomonospora umbrina]
MSPIEDHLRRVLAEHSTGHRPPPDLADRAERRARTTRRRRRSLTAAALTATTAVALALTTPWATEPPATQRAAAAPTEQTPPEGPPPIDQVPSPDELVGTPCQDVLPDAGGPTHVRVTLRHCPPDEAARLRARVRSQCKDYDGPLLDRREHSLPLGDAECLLRALSMEFTVGTPCPTKAPIPDICRSLENSGPRTGRAPRPHPTKST